MYYNCVYYKFLSDRCNLSYFFLFYERTENCLLKIMTSLESYCLILSRNPKFRWRVSHFFSNDYLVSCRLKGFLFFFFLFKLWSMYPNRNRKKEAYMLPAKGCHYDNRTAVLLLLKQNPKIICYSCIHTTTFKSAIRLCRVPHHQKYGLIAWVQIR